MDEINDPLSAIKNANIDEEEKFNCTDETHRPIALCSIESFGIGDLENLMIGMTRRATDNKVAMYYRFRYRDGSKKWNVAQGADGSIWQSKESVKELQAKMDHAIGEIVAGSKLFGCKNPIVHKLLFSGQESMDKIIKIMQNTDWLMGVKIDRKNRKVDPFNFD